MGVNIVNFINIDEDNHSHNESVINNARTGLILLFSVYRREQARLFPTFGKSWESRQSCLS